MRFTFVFFCLFCLVFAHVQIVLEKFFLLPLYLGNALIFCITNFSIFKKMRLVALALLHKFIARIMIGTVFKAAFLRMSIIEYFKICLLEDA